MSIEQITKWRSSDGSEWRSLDEAEFRETLIQDVSDALSFLRPTPAELNWEGYVQQKRDSVIACKTALFAIADQPGILRDWIENQRTSHGKTDRSLIEETHPSWFGRMLDGSHAPLAKAYGRLCCIDGEFREWNQPYYAANPGTGTLKEVSA